MNALVTTLNALVALVGVGCAIATLVRRSPVLGAIGFGLLVLEQVLVAVLSLVASAGGVVVMNAVNVLSSLVGLTGIALLCVGLFARPPREAPADGPGWGGPAYGPEGPPPPPGY